LKWAGSTGGICKLDRNLCGKIILLFT